jgi:hypothetical protein
MKSDVQPLVFVRCAGPQAEVLWVGVTGVGDLSGVESGRGFGWG